MPEHRLERTRRAYDIQWRDGVARADNILPIGYCWHGRSVAEREFWESMEREEQERQQKLAECVPLRSEGTDA